ncbi:hypothetical protein K4F52_008301 [Lecanicillium sp. MT-2017a]|nr:hypothetical protein K4F52_008301 [Lecanicillium sp. MT-2017a]
MSQTEALVPMLTEPSTNGTASTETPSSTQASIAEPHTPSEAQAGSSTVSQQPPTSTVLHQQPTSTEDAPPPFNSLPLPAPPSPAPSAITSSRVTIRVGEREFFTTRPTLSESRLFSDLFAAQPTRTEFFIDDEPDLFAQVLRFMRTRRYPLFYSRGEGHDQVKYRELLAAARFYRVDALETWLAAKRYHGAVWLKTDYKVATLFGQDQIDHLQELAWEGHEEGRILHVNDKNLKVWCCPAKLWRHDGHQMKCTKAKCTRRDGRLYQNQMATMRVLDVKALVTSVEIREDALLAGPSAEVPPPYQG